LCENIGSAANLIDPPEYRSMTVRSYAIHAPKAYYDFLAGTSFEQEEFDGVPPFVFGVHCHFLVPAV
jgi:hypothetical protein